MPCGCSTADSVSFTDSRREKCKACNFATWETPSGICLPIAEKHGIDKADIEHGITRASLKCPKGEWDQVAVQCPKCKRAAPQVFPESIGMCKWCQIKYKNQNSPAIAFPVAKKKVVTHVDDPFSDEPIYNLHYFLYPRYADSVRYHLDQLHRYATILNGRRVVCVATDNHTIHESIRDELTSLFDVVYYVPNDPKRREGVGFIDTLAHFADSGKDDVIFFAHGKGQQAWTHESNIIRDWCDAMYETTLGNSDAVRDSLAAGYSVTGPFRNFSMFRSTRYHWHYSGTFFAARAHRVFSLRDWRATCRHFWASESWVGRHFHVDESDCLFSDHTSAGALYKREYWDTRVRQELKRFRERHLATA